MRRRQWMRWKFSKKIQTNTGFSPPKRISVQTSLCFLHQENLKLVFSTRCNRAGILESWLLWTMIRELPLLLPKMTSKWLVSFSSQWLWCSTWVTCQVDDGDQDDHLWWPQWAGCRLQLLQFWTRLHSRDCSARAWRRWRRGRASTRSRSTMRSGPRWDSTSV